MFALVDGNNFYVSCERVFRPSLNSRLVIVLSSNEGCAIARSNEANPTEQTHYRVDGSICRLLHRGAA